MLVPEIKDIFGGWKIDDKDRRDILQRSASYL